MATVSNPPGIEHFTSFDATGTGQGFLELIPWINPNQDPITNVDQSSDQALTGTYSCLFSEGTIGTSELRTKSLTAPVGSTSATLGGWFFVGDAAVTIDVLVTVGGLEHSASWRFENDDVGKWVERLYSVALSGAQTYSAKIKLNPHAPSSSNRFWLDNYGIDFAPLVEAQPSYCLFGDIAGTVYAIPATSAGDSPAPGWTQSLTGGQMLAAAAIADGTAFVIVAGAGATLYALRIRDGATLWGGTGRQLADFTLASPVPYGEWILAMTADGWLRAYSRADGMPGWSLDVWQAGSGGRIHINGAVAEDDILYVTTDEGACAVDLKARTRLWKAPGRAYTYPPAVGAGLVYAGSNDGSLYALDASTGASRWSRQTGGPVNSEPQFGAGTVIFGSDDGSVYVLDAGAGTLVSKLTFPGQTISCFLFYANVLITVGNAVDGAVYCHRLAVSGQSWTWTQVWSRPLVNGAQADPGINGSHVYITATDGWVYSLDIADGSVEWRYMPGAVAMVAPATAVPAANPNGALKYSDMCWLCTHNAFANGEEGWLFNPQQGPSMEHQLDEGVRALMLDVWLKDGTPVLAHASTSWTRPWLSLLPFATALERIKAWLDANPNEIVTLYLEQRTGRAEGKAKTQAAVAASGIGPYVFNPVTAAWNVQQQGWPTLDWMINAGKRLVVFSDWGWFSGTDGMSLPDGDGFPRVWQYCVENDYGNASMNGRCVARAGSHPITTPVATIPLFIQNYFLSTLVAWWEIPFGAPILGHYDWLNDSTRIMQFVQGCNGINGRLPNLLAVDWYQNGDNGGPRAAVAQINKLRRSSP
jgi:outer membrane protein assembly factor BamB